MEHKASAVVLLIALFSDSAYAGPAQAALYGVAALPSSEAANNQLVAVGRKPNVPYQFNWIFLHGAPGSLKVTSEQTLTTGELWATTRVSDHGPFWMVGDIEDPGFNGTRRSLAISFDGHVFKRFDTPNFENPETSPGLTDNFLFGVAGMGDDIWAVGMSGGLEIAAEPLLIHWNGKVWEMVAHPPNEGGSTFNNVLNAVTVLDTKNAWAVGWHQDSGTASQRTLTYHWNGAHWVVDHALDPGTTNLFNGVTGVHGGDDVWVVGSVAGSKGQMPSTATLVERRHAGSWQRIPSLNLYNTAGTDNQINGVAGLTNDDVWAVGCAYSTTRHPTTLIFHWNGSYFDMTTQGPGCLHAITALSRNNIWAVGESDTGGSLVLHRSNNGWSVVATP